MERKSRPQLLQDLDKTLRLNRIPQQIWALLLLLYVPIGLLLALLRICMSLQAFLILFIFPEGMIKRFILRIYFGVLGLVVTTEGRREQQKLIVSNKISYIDHIALHLATNCITVSTVDNVSPLISLFPHHVLKSRDDESLEDEFASLPLFHDVDCFPYAIQPECMPTNGCHMLLQFSSWPFAIDTPVQPVALNSFRSLPIPLTTANSSGWGDLLWTIFVPFTYYHVTFLPPVERQHEETSDQFAKRVQQSLASHLKVKTSQVSQKDVERWFSDPPRPPAPPPPRPMPTGPIIPPSDFDPAELSSFSSLNSSPEVEAMVQQVTAVLPQVPHTDIRKDLVKTRNVNATITNFLEGRVKYQPIATLYPTATATSSRKSEGGKPKSKTTTTNSSKSSGLFGSKAKNSNSPSLSAQRHISFEERKKTLLEQARRRYIEKHGT